MHALKSHTNLTETCPLDADIRDLSALRIPAAEKMRLFSLLYQVDHAPLLPSDATGQIGRFAQWQQSGNDNAADRLWPGCMHCIHPREGAVKGIREGGKGDRTGQKDALTGIYEPIPAELAAPTHVIAFLPKIAENLASRAFLHSRDNSIQYVSCARCF